MASAASTNSFSIMPTSRSTTAAMVGGACGVGAGVAGLAAPWENAPTAEHSRTNKLKILACFIRFSSSLSSLLRLLSLVSHTQGPRGAWYGAFHSRTTAGWSNAVHAQVLHHLSVMVIDVSQREDNQ